EMALVDLEKVGKVAADAVLAAIAERLRGRRVDGENHAGQIMRADQAKAVLDQLAIALLAVVQRDAGLLPRHSHSGQRCLVGSRGRIRRRPGARFGRVWLRHWLNRKL